MDKSLQVLFAFVMFFYGVNKGNSQQRISVNADSYGQEFKGSGGSCGLYIGHYLSMSEENRLEASRLLFEELRLNYIKEYVDDVPEKDGDLYDKISTFVSNAKIYNPNLKFVLCANNLPDELEEKDNDGKPIKAEYDASIPNIFDKIAEYYFKACEGYFLRGHVVEIFEPVNERGYGDGKVTELFDQVISKFRAMVADPQVNTHGIPMPLIAGPSTWSAGSPGVFINGWKADRPNAWANTDIVATHGYQKSTEANYQATYQIAEGKEFIQSEQTGKLQRGETIGVDVLGEQFSEGYSPDFVHNAAIAKHMVDFFNGGGNSFWAFLTNTHKYDHNAGLLGTPWASEPGPTNIFYGFKHLSATHPIGAKKVGRGLTGIDTDYFKTVVFRKEGENRVYVHILNLYDVSQQVTLDIQGKGIKEVEVVRTDEFNRFNEVENRTFLEPLAEYIINTPRFSVTTVKVELEGMSSTVLQEQRITFESIDDVSENNGNFNLVASSSSGLPVSYKILEGPANLDGNTVTVTGVGLVTVLAEQEGDNVTYPAQPVQQSFYVRPEHPNVALSKPVSASSQYNSTYVASNAVDGDVSSNSSRWLSGNSISNFSVTPQWIEIDLGANYEVSALGLYTGFNNYKNPIYEFDFQVWDEVTQSWQSAITENENFNPAYLKPFTPLIGSKVRLYMDAAPDDYIVKLFEIEVYGEYHSEVESLNNIALNKTVTINYGEGSYTHHNAYTPDKATDGVKAGDTDSRWLFRYDINELPVELEIDLDGTYRINAYSMFEDHANSSFTSEYEIQYWNGDVWVSILEKSAVNGNIKDTHDIVNETFNEVKATKVKFIFKNHTQNSNNNFIRLYEIEVYGVPFSLGLDSASLEKATLYPNPVTSSVLTVKNINNVESLSVYNILGALQKVSFQGNQVKVGHLPAGIYLLVINNRYTSKFIKL